MTNLLSSISTKYDLAWLHVYEPHKLSEIHILLLVIGKFGGVHFCCKQHRPNKMAFGLIYWTRKLRSLLKGPHAIGSHSITIKHCKLVWTKINHKPGSLVPEECGERDTDMFGPHFESLIEWGWENSLKRQQSLPSSTSRRKMVSQTWGLLW